MQKFAADYGRQFEFEVLSGGMIISETPRPVGLMASYIQRGYKVVEERTGIRFGSDFLWHINNPDKSDWLLNSEKPAIALCVFKDYHPDQQVAFASDLQYALNYEGRDLSDDEAYRHLLEQYNIPAADFYSSLHIISYKEKAYYEFALVKQLQVTGFPAVLLQVSESKFYLISKGYTDYPTLKARVENILHEIREKESGNSPTI